MKFKAIVWVIGFIIVFGACGPSKEEMKKEIKEEIKKEIKEEMERGTVGEAQKAAEYLNKSKYRTSLGDIKTIMMAVEDYMTDNYTAPKVTAFSDLKNALVPFYIKTMPVKDAWGKDFLYKVTGEKEDIYFIGSGGSDGIFEGFNQKGKYGELRGQDIIASCGVFVYAPEKKVIERDGDGAAGGGWRIPRLSP